MSKKKESIIKYEVLVKGECRLMRFEKVPLDIAPGTILYFGEMNKEDVEKLGIDYKEYKKYKIDDEDRKILLRKGKIGEVLIDG